MRRTLPRRNLLKSGAAMLTAGPFLAAPTPTNAAPGGENTPNTVNTFVANIGNNTDSAKGAALVGYLASDTGASGRVVHAKLDEIVNAADFGVVYGTVSSAQRATNLAALHAARNALVSRGCGALEITGLVEVDGMFDLQDLGDCPFEIHGKGGLAYGARIVCHAESAIDHFVSLKGTRRINLRGLTIDCNNLAKYGLYCARTGYPATAGKHTFENLFVINATIASHLNYASEENTYIKCQFQRSPIGAIITGYPVTADPTVLGSAPVDFDATYQDTTAGFFYDCAFGSAVPSNPTTRAGLITCGAQVNLYGGVIQTSPGAEAYVITDRSYLLSTFNGVNLDSGLAKIGYKIGHFTTAKTPRTSWSNRLAIQGGDLSVNATTGTAHLDAYNLRDSVIGPIRVSGTSALGAILRDAGCTNNVFNSVFYDDDTAWVIDDTAATSAAANIMLGRGRVIWLNGSGSGAANYAYYNSSLSGRVTYNSGLAVNPPGNVTPFSYIRQGDTSSLLNITPGNHGGNISAEISWGSGAGPCDTNLYRCLANVLQTDDQLRALDGVVTKTVAGAVTDASFTAPPPDGTLAVDTTNNKIYVRLGGVWRSVTLA